MTNILKIKRSATTATPASLQEGELAYSEQSGNLFIGTNGGLDVTKIGGKTDVLALSTHIADSTIHFTQAAISITASQVSDFDTAVDGRIGVASINDLADVVVDGSPTLTIDDVLQWNGSNWVNVPATTVGVTDHGNLTGLGDDDHVQYALVDGTRAFTGTVTVNGDLIVTGTTTTIDSTVVEVADNILVLNNGEIGAGVSLGQSGIEIDRGTEFNTRLVWDESVDKWGQTGIDGSPVGTFTAFSLEGHTHDASDVVSGQFADARISESSVTQHEGAIDHDALTNFVANEHVDHSTVSITGGEGLSGGGDITASRTIDLDLNSLVTITETDGAVDYAVVYKPGSPNGHRKILINDLLDGGTF